MVGWLYVNLSESEEILIGYIYNEREIYIYIEKEWTN